MRHTSHGVQPVSSHEVHAHHHGSHDSEAQKTALERHRLDVLSHEFDFMAKDSFYREINKDFEDPYATYSHANFDQTAPKSTKTHSEPRQDSVPLYGADLSSWSDTFEHMRHHPVLGYDHHALVEPTFHHRPVGFSLDSETEANNSWTDSSSALQNASENNQSESEFLALYGASELFGQLAEMEPRKERKPRRSHRRERTNGSDDEKNNSEPEPSSYLMNLFGASDLQ